MRTGIRVEQDQLLYRIDPGSAQTALQQAQLSVQQAQMNYDTLASSLQVKAIGGGVVQTLHVQEGDLVSAGTAIADITDTASMTLTVPFQSADAANISVGRRPGYPVRHPGDAARHGGVGGLR